MRRAIIVKEIFEESNDIIYIWIRDLYIHECVHRDSIDHRVHKDGFTILGKHSMVLTLKSNEDFFNYNILILIRQL